MIDGSNDTGIAKMYPVTVRIYDVNFNRVMKKFLDMNLIEGSKSGTAATIFQHVDALFQKYEISWNSVTGLGVDNIGACDSIKSWELAKQPNVVVAGCPCHMRQKVRLHLQMLLGMTWKIIVFTCFIDLINQLRGKEF